MKKRSFVPQVESVVDCTHPLQYSLRLTCQGVDLIAGSKEALISVIFFLDPPSHRQSELRRIGHRPEGGLA